MVKIPKNRRDNEMLSGFTEQPSFEHVSDGDTSQPIAKPAKTDMAKPAYAAFFTPELQEELGKALLTLKLKLYKEGIVDYSIKVSSEGNQIVLKPIPLNKQPKQRAKQ